MKLVSLQSLTLALAASAIAAGTWAALTPDVHATAGLFCTTVSKTGTCKIRYGGITYCSTIGGTGTETCPPGTRHVGASDSPRPCLPVGGPCTRTILCCIDEN
jgi:hypothetical protein